MLFQTRASVRVGVKPFGLDLQTDEIRTSAIPQFLQAIGIDEPRRVVGRIGHDRGEESAEVGGHEKRYIFASRRESRTKLAYPLISIRLPLLAETSRV